LKQYIDFLIYVSHRADAGAIRAGANYILREDRAQYLVDRQ
jgi:hypothetical protein